MFNSNENKNVMTNDQKSDKNRRFSSSMIILNSDVSNEILSSSYSRDSSVYERPNSLNQDENNNSQRGHEVNSKKLRSSLNYDEFELDSRQELMFHSIGTGSDNSVSNLHEPSRAKKPAATSVNNSRLEFMEKQKNNGSFLSSTSSNNNRGNKITKNLNPSSNSRQGSKAAYDNDYDSSILLEYETNGANRQIVNDQTTRGGPSTTYNAQVADSLSTLSDKKKKLLLE